MEPSHLQLAVEPHADSAVEESVLGFAGAPGLAALHVGDFWLDDHLASFYWLAGHWCLPSGAGSHRVHPW